MLADIPYYKLNNKHIKKVFHDIGYSLLSETTCRITVLQLSADELQQIRYAVHDKQIFPVVDESTLSGTQHLNILVGSQETPQVSYLCGCQLLLCLPNSNSIPQTVYDDAKSLGNNRNSFSFLLYSMMMQNIWWLRVQ